MPYFDLKETIFIDNIINPYFNIQASGNAICRHLPSGKEHQRLHPDSTSIIGSLTHKEYNPKNAKGPVLSSHCESSPVLAVLQASSPLTLTAEL